MTPSSSVLNFLENIQSAEELINGTELLPVGGDENALNDKAKRFMRNGVAVSLFSSFEEFLWERTHEISKVLQRMPVRYAELPENLKKLIRNHSVSVLAKRQGSDFKQLESYAFAELAKAWDEASETGSIPHSALIWSGSNVGKDDVLRPLQGIGVIEKWSDITGVLTLLGGKVALPTDKVFQEIADARHCAAHSPSYDTPLVFLRPNPTALRLLAFGFDVLLSSAAFQLTQNQVPSKVNRSDLRLSRIETTSRGTKKICDGEYRESERGRSIKDSSVKTQVICEKILKGYTVVEVDRNKQGFVDIGRWVTPV